MTKPKYNHDCDQCRFLGRYENNDLYICIPKTKDTPSLIARYGSAPHKYTSTLVGYTLSLSDPSANKALRIAYLIAEDMGLIRGHRDAHVEGYRVLEIINNNSICPCTKQMSKEIPNKREAYRLAFNSDNEEKMRFYPNFRVEVVQIISSEESHD